jgi:hypothetical protein
LRALEKEDEVEDGSRLFDVIGAFGLALGAAAKEGVLDRVGTVEELGRLSLWVVERGSINVERDA